MIYNRRKTVPAAGPEFYSWLLIVEALVRGAVEGASNCSGLNERPLDQLTFEGDEHRVSRIMVYEVWTG